MTRPTNDFDIDDRVRPRSVARSPTRWRALVVLVAFLAGAGASELSLRLFWPAEFDTELLRRRTSEFEITTLKRYSNDPDLYYELLPDHTSFTRVPGVDGGKALVAKFVTDSEGFRIADEPVPRTPGVRGAPVRFALIGPSTAYGWRVPFNVAYGEQLRQRLERRWRRPVDLRDFGVPAYNSNQETRVFETRVLAWHPDFVVWNYDHRDAYAIISPGDPIGLAADFGDNLLHSAVVKLLLRRVRERTLEKARFSSDYTLHNDYITSGRNFDEHLAALGRMARLAADHQLPIVLFVHDSFIERLPADPDHYKLLHEPVLHFLAQNAGNVHVLDLFPKYQEVMRERGWNDLKPWWVSVEQKDGHPNADGHAFIADQLDAFIATLPDIDPPR